MKNKLLALILVISILLLAGCNDAITSGENNVDISNVTTSAIEKTTQNAGGSVADDQAGNGTGKSLVSSVSNTSIPSKASSEASASSTVDASSTVNTSRENPYNKLNPIAALEAKREANNALANVKTYSTATVDEDFDDSSVMVNILHDFSIQGKEYTVADFKNIDNTLSVENLMKLEPGEYETRPNKLVNYDGFVQILSVELKEPGKENVIALIKEIEKLDFVKSASPNYYYEDEFD